MFLNNILYFFGFKEESSQLKKLDNELFSKLPYEIIKDIFVYCGLISYRNGVYINRISNTDYRYNILRTIPKKFSYYCLDIFVVEVIFDKIINNKFYKIFVYYKNGIVNHKFIVCSTIKTKNQIISIS